MPGARLDHRHRPDGAVRGRHPVGDRLGGRLLDVRLDGGDDLQPAGVHAAQAFAGGVAELLHAAELLEGVVAEPGRPGGDAPAPGLVQVQPQLGLARFRRLRFAYGPYLGHPGENGVPATDRGLGVACGVVLGWALDEPGERGGLGQGQVFGGRVEVVPSRSLHAVVGVPRRAAEVRDVQVVLQDLVLREPPLDGHGQPQLVKLAQIARRTGGGERVPPVRGAVGLVELHELDVLLGEGGPAGDRLSRLDVLQQRTSGALEVDGAAVVETVVLDRQDGVPKHRRDIVQLHRRAVLLVEHRQRVAVTVHHARPLGEGGDLQVGRHVGERLRAFARTEPEAACNRERQARYQHTRKPAHHDEDQQAEGAGNDRSNSHPGPLTRSASAFTRIAPAARRTRLCANPQGRTPWIGTAAGQLRRMATRSTWRA